MKTWEKLIEITELDEFAEAAFRGYNSLNRIQSRIFHTIYYTNGNILVCAPTGACKTNIAMISILHEIAQHFKDGYLHKDEFKIVYVAPMKALAAEVTSTFSHRLSPLNITVRELTGDMQLYKNELEETQVTFIKFCVLCVLLTGTQKRKMKTLMASLSSYSDDSRNT
ncbi:DExH-box ATP-dependent RNA helicase DExH14-like [Prunus persica]|uniref:DExH-box ATP-dependent RNA helicase DExH14-like n=1 Tax=Prunus persica TaxID=3760 RepID=UPI0009AB562A|nr:DExH-box ATP-dependent RNA helicase DExH14-like [Prunus persica]